MNGSQTKTGLYESPSLMASSNPRLLLDGAWAQVRGAEFITITLQFQKLRMIKSFLIKTNFMHSQEVISLP